MVKEFMIRPAQESDARNVFALSNDAAVRAHSTNRETIDWKDHLVWFHQTLADQETEFYIIETCKKELMAQARFKKSGEFWIVSFSLCPQFRGQKRSPEILKEAMKLTGGTRFLAYIKQDNGASIAMFKRIGYDLCGEELLNGETHLVYQYGK